ncbi:MAG: hypothetical protein QF473_36415, partial [Planctomycetota bacterium]|nr:hypothetical protein [Planctomycetota bacterium]
MTRHLFMRKFLSILLNAALCCALHAENRALPVLRASNITKPIRIDGRLDDPGWKTILPRTLGDNGAKNPNTIKTRVLFGYGTEDIFIAFHCEETDSTLGGKGDGSGFSIFAGDTVEVFLDCTGGRKMYWHFAVDPTGLRYDGFGLNSVAETEWQAEVSTKKGEWTVEIRIPVSSLGITSKTSSNWTGNLCRTRPARPGGGKKPMYWAFAGSGPFHRPDRFAEIVGLDLDFNQLLVRTARQQYGEIYLLLERAGHLAGQLKADGGQEVQAFVTSAMSSRQRISKLSQACLKRITKSRRVGDKSLDELAALRKKARSLHERTARAAAAGRLGIDIEKTGFLVGIAPGERRIYSNRPFMGELAVQADLQLARNEYEGIQIVVLPLGKRLENVHVTAGDLIGPGQARIHEDDID